MTKLFGTDGIRGAANRDLSADLALRVGRAVAAACRGGALGAATARPTVLIGRDTRPSGDMLEAALAAGLCSAGANAVRAGVIPSPAVAWLTADLGAAAGIVISASHNPPADNGIKVFGPGGWKLDEPVEEALERLIGAEGDLPADVGHVSDLPDAASRYVDHLVSSIPVDVAGMRVIVDCAHGAAWRVAPEALRRLGADVVALHDAPDGERINQGCGATHPEVVADAARRAGAIGLTHDGDADRVLAADETGEIVDGDAIIALIAGHLKARGALAHDAVALTVMSNQATRRWYASHGVEVVETPVGDRHVLAAMRERGLVLGGEQSGHVLRLDLATTGDGILTSLALLEVVTASGGRLADVVPFKPLPQVLVNVAAPRRQALAGCEPVWAAVRAAEDELGDAGRVLLRPSGTEPLVRVMVEAATSDEATRLARRIAAVVERELTG